MPMPPDCWGSSVTMTWPLARTSDPPPHHWLGSSRANTIGSRLGPLAPLTDRLGSLHRLAPDEKPLWCVWDRWLAVFRSATSLLSRDWSVRVLRGGRCGWPTW